MANFAARLWQLVDSPERVEATYALAELYQASSADERRIIEEGFPFGREWKMSPDSNLLRLRDLKERPAREQIITLLILVMLGDNEATHDPRDVAFPLIIACYQLMLLREDGFATFERLADLNVKNNRVAQMMRVWDTHSPRDQKAYAKHHDLRVVMRPDGCEVDFRI